jgi:hypothetical protein
MEHPVPVVPSSSNEPVWDQFAALLPSHHDLHPLGCHRPRIPDRVVFDTLVQMLVFGCASHRIADSTCLASTLRRRRDAWIAAGELDMLRDVVLGACDRMIGLDLAVDAAGMTPRCWDRPWMPWP